MENPFAWPEGDDANLGLSLKPFRGLSNDFYACNCILAVTLGLTTTSTMLYFVLFHKKASFGHYNRMLLMCSVVDIIFLIGSAINQIQIEILDGVLLVNQNGPISVVNSYKIRSAFLSWESFSIHLSITILPAYHYCRYKIIHNEPMDDYNLLKCFSSSFLLALFETIFAYVSFVYSGTHWEHFNYATLLDDTQWIHNKIMPMLIVVNMRHITGLVYFSLTLVVHTLCYAVGVFYGYRSWKLTNIAKRDASERTLYFHNLFTKIVTLQTIVPLIGVVGPIMIICGCTLIRVNIPDAGTNLMAFLHWLPFFNSMCTLYLLKPFRDKVFGILRRKSGLSLSVVKPAPSTL